MSGSLSHAFGTAAWAETAFFTTEGDNLFVTARRAVKAYESVGQNTAFEISLELFEYLIG
jgi:hypothetical protein